MRIGFDDDFRTADETRELLAFLETFSLPFLLLLPALKLWAADFSLVSVLFRVGGLPNKFPQRTLNCGVWSNSTSISNE